MDFGENIACSNCSGLCCGWILDYNLCEKMWQYQCVGLHDKAYFIVLFGSEYMDVIYENCIFCLGAANMLEAYYDTAQYIIF